MGLPQPQPYTHRAYRSSKTHIGRHNSRIHRKVQFHVPPSLNLPRHHRDSLNMALPNFHPKSSWQDRFTMHLSKYVTQSQIRNIPNRRHLQYLSMAETWCTTSSSPKLLFNNVSHPRLTHRNAFTLTLVPCRKGVGFFGAVGRCHQKRCVESIKPAGFRVPYLARQTQDTDEMWKVLGGNHMSRL
jgi:hypothetical protein